MATCSIGVLAEEAMTVQAVADGRFRLGIGTGHPILVEQAFGASPIRRCRRRARRPPRAEAAGSPTGTRGSSGSSGWGQQRGIIDVEPSLALPVVLGALSPRLAAGGALADGVVTWLTPAAYIADVLAHAVASGSQRTNVVAPLIVACVPAIVTDDRTVALVAAEVGSGVALRAPAFRAMLEAAGAIGRGQPADLGFTDVLLDHVVAGRRGTHGGANPPRTPEPA